MKVLITGGCGFVGSNLAAAYLNSHDEVVVVDNLSRQGSAKNLEWLQRQADTNQLQFHKFDLSDYQDTFDVVSQSGPFDYVCHLAGQVAMTTSMDNPLADFNSNTVATVNLLEVFRLLNPNAFFAYSSTNKVYGELAHLSYIETDSRFSLDGYGGEIDESHPLDFSTPYGCSKGAADQYVRDWSRTFGLSTVVFRHSSIYGGRQFATYDQGWVGWFCLKALEQQMWAKECKAITPFTVSGTGKQVRDLLHIDDVVRLYQVAYTSRHNIAGHIFNIGGGLSRSLSIVELLARLEVSLDMPKLCYDTISRRSRDQDYFVANTTKALELIGWTPSIPLSVGIDQMLGWAHEILNHD